jgi:hypothetical protein
MSFLDRFNEAYYPQLGRRAATFRKAFVLLEEKNKDYYTIIETGCVRSDRIAADGYSTVLFDQFVNAHDGRVYSVDINQEHCQFARKLVSDKTEIICSDSVEFLWNFRKEREIDLLYLDSYDLVVSNPQPAMLHCLEELCAAINKLDKGTIILIDDHYDDQFGKGAYVLEFMNKIKCKRAFYGYHIGWVLV